MVLEEIVTQMRFFFFLKLRHILMCNYAGTLLIRWHLIGVPIDGLNILLYVPSAALIPTDPSPVLESSTKSKPF